VLKNQNLWSFPPTFGFIRRFHLVDVAGIDLRKSLNRSHHQPATGANFRSRTRLNAAADTSNNCRNFHRPTTRLRPIPATDFNHPKHSSTFFRRPGRPSSCLTGAPTDPDVRVSRIRLFG
jgi:hypothetical protein